MIYALKNGLHVDISKIEAIGEIYIDVNDSPLSNTLPDYYYYIYFASGKKESITQENKLNVHMPENEVEWNEMNATLRDKIKAVYENSLRALTEDRERLIQKWEKQSKWINKIKN